MENKETKEKFNKKQIVKELFAILITSLLMLSVVPELPFATNTTTDKTNSVNDNSVVTAKAANVKVTWDANGGKIGKKNTKVTKIKKGTKLKKLQTPKQVNYKFKGWYTKKIGGKKITKNTKHNKKATYYAQWKRVLNNEEKKLVGQWVLHWDGSSVYEFKADGTYYLLSSFKYYDWAFSGVYSLKNGILKVKYRHSKDYGGGFKLWSDWEEGSPKKMKFYTRDDGSEYFEINDGLAYDKKSII